MKVAVFCSAGDADAAAAGQPAGGPMIISANKREIPDLLPYRG